jgi:hypothetical protein
MTAVKKKKRTKKERKKNTVQIYNTIVSWEIVFSWSLLTFFFILIFIKSQKFDIFSFLNFEYSIPRDTTTYLLH